MSKEQLLSEEIENIFIDNRFWSPNIGTAIATKDILKAIDSRLPKEPNSDTTAHLEINQIDDWELGYHQALSDVRKELGL